MEAETVRYFSSGSIPDLLLSSFVMFAPSVSGRGFLSLMSPQYPVYIISKGRWRIRLTANTLERFNLQFFTVIEESEWVMYANERRRGEQFLILPEQYLKDYDTCDNIPYGAKSVGPGAARNYCWEHSISNGYTSHWVMDDNISAFFRQNRNFQVPVTSGTVLRIMEDFCDRYENVAIAGPNYDFFADAKAKMPPYVLNTRIYSCLLIRNSIPFRWRARYNEDTDLSLRALKSGLVTVQFNAFLQEKATTQTIGGGNTREFYEVEGTSPKSEMLVKLHPDVSRLMERFNRAHHYVDYRAFRLNRLKRKVGIEIPDRINNYGMKLINVKTNEEIN